MEETRGTGKWREQGVPHKGWSCNGIDYDSNGRICQMCEVAFIKWIHILEHQDYPDELKVGCICAGHMTEDLVGARNREIEYKKRQAKKDRLLNKKWKTSYKGNMYLNTNGWNIVVFEKNGLWSGCIKNGDKTYFLKYKFADSNTAKLRVVEMLEHLRG
jgi:hypothetical protein